MFINRKENHIVYYGKEYEPHEYIKMNICANRGSHSALFKDDLIELAEDRKLSGKKVRKIFRCTALLLIRVPGNETGND